MPPIPGAAPAPSGSRAPGPGPACQGGRPGEPPSVREAPFRAPPRGTLSRAAAAPRPPFAAAMAGEYRLLLENARQLVLVCGRGEKYLLRAGMASLAVLQNASLVVGQ